MPHTIRTNVKSLWWSVCGTSFGSRHFPIVIGHVKVDTAVKYIPVINENCYAMTFGGQGITMGLTVSPSLVALVHKNLLYVECTRFSRNISLIYVQVLYGQKHNSTMVSNASPGIAAPKMNESFVHMAHVSSDRACAQDG